MFALLRVRLALDDFPLRAPQLLEIAKLAGSKTSNGESRRLALFASENFD
jgi:hypothetical protein